MEGSSSSHSPPGHAQDHHQQQDGTRTDADPATRAISSTTGNGNDNAGGSPSIAAHDDHAAASSSTRELPSSAAAPARAPAQQSATAPSTTTAGSSRLQQHGHALGTVNTAASNSSNTNTNNKFKSKALVNAEAATAAALSGTLHSPGISNISPTTATSLGSSSASSSHALDSTTASAGGNRHGNDAKAGEGTITNAASIGPPTPSATRLPFLPSALKKNTAPLTAGNAAMHTTASSTKSFNSGTTATTSSSLSSDATVRRNNAAESAGIGSLSSVGNNGDNAGNAAASQQQAHSSSSFVNAFKRNRRKEKTRSNTNVNAGRGTSSIRDDPNDRSNTSTTVNAYEKSYNASAAKVRSKREREEAREEREKERLFGNNMVVIPTQNPSSSLTSSVGSTSVPLHLDASTSSSSSTAAGHTLRSSSSTNVNAPISSSTPSTGLPLALGQTSPTASLLQNQQQGEGWPLNHTTKGTGTFSRPNSSHNNLDKRDFAMSGGINSTANNGGLSLKRSKTPAATSSRDYAASRSNSQPTSLGFASPHMSPALLEAGGGASSGRFSRENSYLNDRSGSGNNGRKSARQLKEDEEDQLAAQLGGGIGPTTSRIIKSTKKGPTSPNNVKGEKMAADLEKEQQAFINSKRGGNENEKGGSSKSRRGKTGFMNTTDEEGTEGEGISGGRGSNANRGGSGGKKDTQLQFSPKVRKPINLSWRAIKRKLLLASTGTPSSGGGSRRSETSETSGGSRHRMYNANTKHPNATHGHGTGEKQVHIEGVDDGLGQEDWEVDQVVVDNDWFDDEGNPILWGSAHSGSAANGQTGGNAHGGAGHGGHGSASHPHNTHGERVSNSGKDTTTNHSETAGSLIINPTIKVIDGVVTFFRGYLIPKLAYFFEPRFGDPEKELNFRKERWYNTKRNAAFGCFFLILNWILLIALVNMQGTYQKVLYYGALTFFVIPMPFFVAFDLPRRAPQFYSFWGITATMMPAFFGIISMYVCHFLRDGSEACNGQTFLTIHYYATGFAMVALFALSINRLATVVSQIIFWILTCVMLLPEAASYARTAINFLVFSAFIIFLHFQQEKIDRRMYTLRTQLKISYRALQKSQIAEKKASNSKKRFISYIFHEVRVPLNTAYLAFQNLQQSNGFNRQDEDQMVEVYALESSLQQVQQVLNDVLDLQRMDAGRFESSSQPFNFHRAINALVASLKVAATAKRLQLDVQLDERIDNLPQSMEVNGQKASYVIGDEIRLRQVLTNIASNAVKFSREGRGGIKLRTKLIWPEEYDGPLAGEQGRISDGSEKPSDGSGTSSGWKDSDITPVHGNKDTRYADSEITFSGQRASREKERDIEKEAGLAGPEEADQSTSYPRREFLPRQESDDSDVLSPYASKRRKDFVIVRIEIEDNGPGIRPSDMVDQRLFSAYVQTEIGRVQGGKGSGLGLAIVRAIVQMTRGRLGVQSSKNGTTFWIEQRYHFATQQEVEALQALQDLPTPYSSYSPEPLSKPVRPPVKPYKTGESSYSQYSASKMEAAMSLDNPNITPSSETERPLLIAAVGGLPLPGTPTSAAANLSAENVRAGSASISSLPSATSHSNTSAVGTSSATNAIDIHSPLTSEQWSQNNVERSVMPTMNVTAPTPPVGSSTAPVPSPTRSTASGKVPFPAPSSSASAGGSKPPTPASTGRKFSDDASSVLAGAPAVASPAGEEAFTPMTRQVVTSPTPEGEIPPIAESARFSPLPMPAVRSRPSSQASVPSVAASQTSTSGSGAANTSGGQGASERLTALVVDDDPLTRKLMSRMMARLGCQVEDAENGQMFLDVVLGNEEQGRAPKHFDIVTLDNAMPVMTGEQAIKHFRKAGRSDLVVGATGNALKGDQTAYLRAGVDTVLTKPISARDLTVQLNLARKRRQERQDQAAVAAADAAAAASTSVSAAETTEKKESEEGKEAASQADEQSQSQSQSVGTAAKE